MSRPIQLSEAGAPAPGFDQPFEMLAACHERIERSLALLARLRDHVRTQGADEQARQAARDVLRYFDLAAPQHHLDEERHVLPALKASGDAALVQLAQRLEADHRRMEPAWAEARSVLTALADGDAGALDRGAAALDAFAGLYAEHLRAEDDTAFPQASSRLQPPQLDAMSQDMRRRRGA